MSSVLEMSGRRLLMVAGDGPVLRTAQDVLDLIGESIAQDARMIVVPVDALDHSFFQLRSGFAGEVLQKLANYHRQLAVLGDISVHTQESTAFRDFVRESNHGSAVFFLADLAALSERLAAMAEA